MSSVSYEIILDVYFFIIVFGFSLSSTIAFNYQNKKSCPLVGLRTTGLLGLLRFLYFFNVFTTVNCPLFS